ncbi:hypothetical protein ABZ342_17550 [Amycolatopsis sp. NPDC005961]|uniref:hypothetical protein n=1 Tax=Amycolatopsis sp. NPDC005961 TaxID=3156720 RepID=UPI00341152C2
MEGDSRGLGRAEPAGELERVGAVALRTTACCLAWVPALAFLLFSHSIGDGPRNNATDILAFCVIAVSLFFTPGAILWWLRYESVRRTGWRAATVTAVFVDLPGCLGALASAGRTNARRLDYVVHYLDGRGARLRGGASLWHHPPLVAFDGAQPAWVGGSGRLIVVLFAGSRWGPSRPRAVPAKFIGVLPARSQ